MGIELHGKATLDGFRHGHTTETIQPNAHSLVRLRRHCLTGPWAEWALGGSPQKKP